MKLKTKQIISDEFVKLSQKKDVTVKELAFITGFLSCLSIDSGIETADQIQNSLDHLYYSRVLSLVEAIAKEQEKDD